EGGPDLRGRRFLDHVLQADDAGLHLLPDRHAAPPALTGRDLLQRAGGSAEPLVRRLQDGRAGRIDRDVVAQQDPERLVPDEGRGAKDRVPESERTWLPHVHDPRGAHQRLQVLQSGWPARLLQMVVQLDVGVEMVLDRALRPAGDNQDLPHPARHGFFDDELDRRLVHERDHFLRLGFRVGEETSGETGGWNDRFHGGSPSAAIDKILKVHYSLWGTLRSEPYSRRN